MRWLTLLVVGCLVLAVSSPAWAMPMVAGYNELKIVNRDNGTVFNIPGGVGAGIGDKNNVALGVAILDAYGPKIPAAGAVGASEDSWGIARTTSILDINSNPVWQEGGATELTWIFYGATDFYAENVDAAGNIVTTQSVGLIASLYEEPLLGGTPFTTALGAAGRTGLNTYTGSTEGTLLLQLQAVPGFIHTPGTLGGALTEFETTFNSSSNSGGGVAYFDVIGGTLASVFNTNTIDTLASIANGVPNADAWLQFTSTPAHDGPNPSGGFPDPANPGYYLPPGAAPYDWLVASDDPLRTSAVPEPATMVLVALGGLGVLFGRKRK